MHHQVQFMVIVKNFLLRESEKINPRNIYGFSKKLNEIIGEFTLNSIN